jgi:hypothetical protein
MTERDLRDALRRLIEAWQLSAEAMRESHPLWSSHFCDCALELEGVVNRNPDDSTRRDAQRPDGAAAP